jgi:hypothetical protein
MMERIEVDDGRPHICLECFCNHKFRDGEIQRLEADYTGHIERCMRCGRPLRLSPLEQEIIERL